MKPSRSCLLWAFSIFFSAAALRCAEPSSAGAAPATDSTEQIEAGQDAVIKMLDLLPDKPKPKPEKEEKKKSGAPAAPAPNRLADVDQAKLDEVGHLIARRLRVETDPAVRETLVAAGRQIIAENDRRDQEAAPVPPPWSHPNIDQEAFRQLKRVAEPLSGEAAGPQHNDESAKTTATAAFEGGPAATTAPDAAATGGGSRFFVGPAFVAGSHDPVVLSAPPPPRPLDGSEPPPPDVDPDAVEAGDAGDDAPPSPEAVLAASLNEALVAVAKEMATAVQSGTPNGVKIAFNDQLLARALKAGSLHDNTADLADLLSASVRGDGGPAAERIVQTAYVRFNQARHLQPVSDLVLVSLAELIREAAPFASHWGDLPERLRHPGGLTRIAGYVLDPAHGDIVLLGRAEPAAPAIELDDLIVGIQSVLINGDYPLISLDPDPGAWGGPQRVRIRGMPRDCSFAAAMLEADYLMKKITMGLVPVADASFHSVAAMMRRRDLQQMPAYRFWLYPVQPEPGDIQCSSDGSTVLFLSSVQVLTEDVLLTREGLVSTGHTEPLSEVPARDFTRLYPRIAAANPVYRRLNGLFDIVLLAKIWQRQNVRSPLLAQLAALPHLPIPIRESYDGVSVSFDSDSGKSSYSLVGGAEARVSVSPRTLLVLDDPGILAVRSAALSQGEAPSLGRSLAGMPIALPASDARPRRSTDLALVRVLARFHANDLAGAAREIARWERDAPYDPEPVAYRGMVELLQGRYEAARRSATQAVAIDPQNTTAVWVASCTLCQLEIIAGRPEAALADMDRALQEDRTSVTASLYRGMALGALHRVPEARAEFKRAIARDPTCVEANVDLGLLEIGDGWTAKGMRLIRAAAQWSKVKRPTPKIEAALAFAEMSAVLSASSQAQEHMGAAAQHAQQALDDPACEPDSRLLALHVQATLAMANSDWERADRCIEACHALAPFLSDIYLQAAESARLYGRDDLASKYLGKAQRLAP